MSTEISNTAFILAAGLGTRLRPHTNDRPKPLVEVNNKTLLTRTLDHLHDAGITKTVLNTHYLADQIPAHLESRTDIECIFSHEPDLLDTGGGIKKMLHHFDAAFFTLSGDGLWNGDALTQMKAAWNPETMDILILIQPITSMHLTKGIGDYDLDPEGRATRSLDQSGDYMFTSIRIHHPRIFENTPDGAFSYLQCLDAAQSAGRLHGLIHTNDWHHISTPEDLAAVNAHYTSRSE